MALSLSPETLATAYDYLRTTSPFDKWNLPDSEDVKFRVIRDQGRFGWYRFDGERHVIAVSIACVGHTDSLMRTMAHEMIHLHEEHSEACTPGVDHSKAFKRWAVQVCSVHGFDHKAF